MFVNRILPRARQLPKEDQKKKVCADIRLIPETKFPNRPGLDKVPLRANKSTMAYQMLGERDNIL
jgi:hypothetical protein